MSARRLDNYRKSERRLFQEYNVELNEHFIEIKELSTRIRLLTTGNGPPILFIHGAPAAGSIWTPLIAHTQCYKNIIIDRPGCGLSEKVSYKVLSKERLQSIMVFTIDAILDYFRIVKIPIVSSSFASSLTLLYTLQRSERVSKLVIEGCPALIKGSEPPSFMKMMLLPVLKWLIPRLPSTASIFNKIMIGLGHRYSVDHQSIPSAFINWYISLFNNTRTQINEIAMVTKAYPSGKVRPSFMLHDGELEEIKQPSLLMWSKDDPFGGIGTACYLKTKLTNSRLLPLENSGHLSWLDNPVFHAEQIKKFIQSSHNKDD